MMTNVENCPVVTHKKINELKSMGTSKVSTVRYRDTQMLKWSACFPDQSQLMHNEKGKPEEEDTYFTSLGPERILL